MNKDVVVLIPVYDPNEKIMQEFLDKLAKSFANIVFINDGCNKKHDKYMNNLAKKYEVIKHNPRQSRWIATYINKSKVPKLIESAFNEVA